MAYIMRGWAQEAVRAASPIRQKLLPHNQDSSCDWLPCPSSPTGVFPPTGSPGGTVCTHNTELSWHPPHFCHRLARPNPFPGACQCVI